VCLSALIEMAWEWEDMTERLYRRYSCKPNERNIFEPRGVILIFTIHHILGLCAIPMNLYYYSEYYYWTICAST